MQSVQDHVLPSWFLFVRRVVDYITSVLNIIGTLLIVSVMILVNSDVIGRGLFNAPISGVPEIVSMSIVAIVFLQVAQAFRKGRLTRSEAFLNFIGKYHFKFRALVDLIFSDAAIILIWKLLTSSVNYIDWMYSTFCAADTLYVTGNYSVNCERGNY